MNFRGNGQRDERRRRVLRDEGLTENAADLEAADKVKSDTSQATPAYSHAALAQPSLARVLPKRPLTLVLLFLIASVGVVAVELLYARCFVHLSAAAQASSVALDVTARGSIASWLSASTLFVGSLLSVLVYMIRRHRIDDYRGRYRVWLWAAAGLTLASLDASTGLHAVVAALIGRATGMSWLATGAGWAIVMVTALFGILYVRMLLELSVSRLATTFLMLAGGLYVAAIVYHWPSTSIVEAVHRAIVGSSTLLSAHICVVFATTLFGRHVLLEAQGALPVRRRTKRVAAEKEEDEDSAPKTSPARRQAVAAPSATVPSLTAASTGKQVRLDAPHEKTAAKVDVQPPVKPATKVEPKVEAKPAVSKTPAPVFIPEADEDDDDDDAPANDASGRPISKAERRRLRKLERRQKQRE